MPKTVVILGAGYAGLPAAHYILKHQATKFDLKVLLVSPADDYYWSIATPRVVIPGAMNEDKVFYPIIDLFSKYDASQFEFIRGKAETWSPERNFVLLAMNDGSHQTIDYDVIIVATGSRAKDQMPWKLMGNSSQTREAIAKLRDEVKSARSITICGGGPTGVELAGELGSEYAKMGKKEVTLITSDSMLLEARVMTALRKTAQKDLERLKVKVITGAKVVSAKKDTTGTTTMEIKNADGIMEMLKTDLFVTTSGMEYNSEFAPADLVLPNGRLKVTKTLQAAGYKNAFVVGDVAEGEPLQVVYAEAQVKHVVTAFEKYFSGDKLPEYVYKSRGGMLVSIGPDRGIGQLGNWRLWSWLIWYFKARHLGTDYAEACAQGKRFIVIGSI
ncbi:hypothetical protein BX600DRAFT_545151 [Xylariales sp. PMI_506]|nr:hypothetical protein BX600DRAFT_545151 [Xylariales sp. PMI_506]